ncbi:MAG: Gfo/Idh/MocA family oxidoreductase [candidate division KSB1 bacterium]|jgi:predicted dehydrogenase|nr:Gfo/Idh/MocA family oxidoreductase [candidate division KSB1 bacterium]
MDSIRWGILGTGAIAHAFSEGLSFTPDAKLTAVGSRRMETAQKFGDKYDIPNRHDSYEALATDPDIDVIYIATPHMFHRDNAILCLTHGKAVLCEKAFTINAAEAAEVISLAREKRLFLMEAMWTRFQPLVVKLRKMLQDGLIGDVRMMTADLGFKFDFDPKSRIFDPALGGGALLDIGIYPLAMAYMIFGAPEKIKSMAILGSTGVDEQETIILGYSGGEIATLYASTQVHTPKEVILIGTKGRIRLHAPIYRPTGMTIQLTDEEDQHLDSGLEGNGYNYEAAEVMNCMRSGQLESAIMPLDETLEIMRTMDALRNQWGFAYPNE